MARVVIEIDGDASGAEAALGDVQGSLGDLDSASESAGGAVAGLNAKLVNAASAVGIAKAGFELLRGGINMLWESTERYFTSTEEGQQMWEDLERQGRALKGMLFELFIGTSDQNEAFARMSAIMGDLVSVSRGAVAVVSPLISLIRGGVGFTLNFASALAGVDREARAAARGLDGLQDEISEAQRRMEAFQEAFSAPSGTDTINRLSESLADELGPGLAQAFEDVAGVMFDIEMQSANTSQSVGTSLNRFQTALSQSAHIVPGFRHQLRELARTEEGRVHIFNISRLADVEHQNQQVALAAAARSSARATSSASSATSGQSISAEEAAISVARLAVETGNATLQILEQKHALDLLNEALGQKADRDKIASEIAVSQLEQKRSLMEQEAEFERAILLKTEGLKEQLAEKEAARAARQKERVDLAKSGYQILTNSAVSMAAASIKSGKKSAEETRKMIGDELVALGAMGLAKSAMMLFEPGKQALAVGLGVASVAAMALGAKMGATAISGGGGVAAPAAGQSQSVTNVTFQNNFAQIGSRDQFLRVTGDAFQEAVDEGYIALPRGA